MESLPSINSPYTYFYQLLDNPLVFIVSSGILFHSGVDLAEKVAKRRACYIVVQPSWNVYSQAKNISIDIFMAKLQNPFAQFIVLCPTPQEVVLVESHGIQALYAHKNAFIDENIFSPRNEVIKKYSAVHIANVEKFKRHYLAWNIKNIAVLAYSYQADSNFSELNGYKDLGYANFSLSNDGCILNPPLSPKEVNSIICAANCGLILSEEEGTNNASTEYLLSGVPVVSTASKGGRDQLFDPNHVLIVDPNSSSVETAVYNMQNNIIDPMQIRESALIKIRQHRKRFLDWLCQVSKQDLYLSADQNYWSTHFVNKLRLTVPIETKHPSV
jgi:glycosyltransferase involved in cell wall biosynthesis